MLNNPPNEYKLPMQCISAVHVEYLKWMCSFVRRLELFDEFSKYKVYTGNAFMASMWRWSFGDEHANNLIRQVKAMSNIIEREHIEHRKPTLADRIRLFKTYYRFY